MSAAIDKTQELPKDSANKAAVTATAPIADATHASKAAPRVRGADQ